MKCTVVSIYSPFYFLFPPVSWCKVILIFKYEPFLMTQSTEEVPWTSKWSFRRANCLKTRKTKSTSCQSFHWLCTRFICFFASKMSTKLSVCKKNWQWVISKLQVIISALHLKEKWLTANKLAQIRWHTWANYSSFSSSCSSGNKYTLRKKVKNDRQGENIWGKAI